MSDTAINQEAETKKPFDPLSFAPGDPRRHLRPWQPGQSGNPGGRPKGLAAKLRDLTNDGMDALEALAMACRGELPGMRARDRIEAAKIIVERIYGKPLEITIDATQAAGAGLALAPELLETLARALSLPGTTVPQRDITDAETVSVTTENP